MRLIHGLWVWRWQMRLERRLFLRELPPLPVLHGVRGPGAREALRRWRVHKAFLRFMRAAGHRLPRMERDIEQKARRQP